jgi:hypothetical protein
MDYHSFLSARAFAECSILFFYMPFVVLMLFKHFLIYLIQVP